jgi:hypothetical protein
MRFTQGIARYGAALAVWLVSTCSAMAAAAEPVVLPPIDQRFAAAEGDEVPSFQRHVVNLFGRLGCNGRSCHGSFQGRGGFQLSLFGYDFQADHGALLDKDSPRVDLQSPDESLIISLPTDEDLHGGGQRYELDSWQHHVLRRWIQSGAPLEEQPDMLVRLEVTPQEIRFERPGQQVQLRAIAVWEDGTREDVSPLSRFSSNDDQVATIDQHGLVTAGEPGDTHVVVFYDNGVTPVPVLQAVSRLTGDRYPDVPAPTQVDRLVVDKLRKLGIVPSDVCSDAEFLRRVSLDITGTLPTPDDVESFLADPSSDKRAKKIDALLESPAYAAWWATRLCDFTGNNDDQLINATPVRGQAGQQWYDWIYRRVADNTPYDELAAGIVTAVSRRPGQDYVEYCEEMSALARDQSPQGIADRPGMTHYWARQDLRDPDARVIAFAYSFMGIRLQCAQCHKHPFDQWSKDDFHQFKNFFTGVVADGRTAAPDGRDDYQRLVRELGLKDKRGNDLRRELPELLKQGKTIPFPEVYVSQRPAGRAAGRGATAAPTAKLLGGEVVDLTEHEDPRDVVMQWLRDPDNRFFARAFVNRVWSGYFHVGIVNPPDDLSLANPPSNAPLLDYLAEGFIASGFDMKWVHREITGSRTYQLSWQSNDTNRGDTRNFSHAIPRRLPAEVVVDAIRQATAADARASQLQGDVSRRAIALAGAGTRNQRSGAAGYALTVFGRSTRESNCDCDRSQEASLLQTVYLQNDREVLQMIAAGQDSWLQQVARQVQPQPPSSRPGPAAGQRQLENYRRQLAAGQARLAKLRQAGEQESAARLARRLDALRRQLRDQEPAPASSSELTSSTAATATSIDWGQLVRAAYLRTLSRHPNPDELSRAVQYVAAAEVPVDGLRDVLWALLNTKEFIVNH